MAGLIPQAFIDDLLSRVDIVDVIDKRVSLKKTGKNYSACCPFHKEKTPAFSVQPERQFYYCFGCGVGGNAIGFVMNFDQVDFPQAVESLAQDNGMEVPREESKAAIKKQSDNARLLDTLEQACKFYQYQLRQHEKKQAAVDYLRARGVSGEIARDFRLGYAPPGWDNLLSALGSDETQQQSLLKAVLVVQKDRQQDSSAEPAGGSEVHCYDCFRHLIMLSFRQRRGLPIAWRRAASVCC